MKNNKFLLLSLLFLSVVTSVNAMKKDNSSPSVYIDGNGLKPHNENSRPLPSWGRNSQGLWVLYNSNGNAIQMLGVKESKERDKLLGITYQY